MKALDREHVRSVVNTIFSQILHTTPMDVINSWGISRINATQIYIEDFAMAALALQVNGFQFQGKVYIALDEGSDYYRSMAKSTERPWNIIETSPLTSWATCLTQ